MRVELVLEENCTWGTASNMCTLGYETEWIKGAWIKVGLCPQCHGRARVLTSQGRDLIEFVKFWIEKEN